MNGFISYAHADHREYEILRQHLKPIERAFGINFWADHRIQSGDYWTSKIADAIKTSEINLLLLSPAFLDSDYIFDHELPAIRGRHLARALVIPVILKRCMWEPFVGALLATPRTSQGLIRPIAEWSPRAHGFNAAREQIAEAIQHYYGLKPTTSLAWGEP
jgi:hypothetical protein